MKIIWKLYLTGFVLWSYPFSTKAQVSPGPIRNTDTISYYINNPYGSSAELTWTVTNGTILGHSSPYTAYGADTINVIWDDINKTSANIGSLTVSEIVHWPGGASCASEEEQIIVESWARPKAAIDTSEKIVCSGEAFTISVGFEGKPEYRYKWKLYDKENPAIMIEDHTANFTTSTSPSTDIMIAGIKNNSGIEKIYEFEVTDVQDGLIDSIPGDISQARVSIRIQPKIQAGTLKSNNQLIRR